MLLSKCYELVGLQAPQWLELHYEEKETLEETILEEFTERFKKLIHDLFARYITRVIELDPTSVQAVSPDKYDLESRLKILLNKNMIPGVRLKDQEVVITQQLLRELGLDGRISLKSLAELLGWQYKPVRLGTVVKAAVAAVDQLLQPLQPQDQQQPQRGQGQGQLGATPGGA